MFVFLYKFISKERNLVSNSLFLAETSSLRAGVEEQKTKLMPKQRTVNDLKAKIEIAQSELKLLEDKGNSGKKQLEDAMSALEQASKRAAEAVS